MVRLIIGKFYEFSYLHFPYLISLLLLLSHFSRVRLCDLIDGSPFAIFFLWRETRFYKKIKNAFYHTIREENLYWRGLSIPTFKMRLD